MTTDEIAYAESTGGIFIWIGPVIPELYQVIQCLQVWRSNSVVRLLYPLGMVSKKLHMILRQ